LKPRETCSLTGWHPYQKTHGMSSATKDTLDTIERDDSRMRDAERMEARSLIEFRGHADYCAGAGHPVIRCRSLKEWDAATAPKRERVVS
jgi:hypothetical protein